LRGHAGRSGTFPIAFGDFKAGYVIVEKVGIKWLRDPFTGKPNVLFYAYRRVGGDVANSDAIKLLKVST
jgi:HK97 family phage major capsid protein